MARTGAIQQYNREPIRSPEPFPEVDQDDSLLGDDRDETPTPGYWETSVRAPRNVVTAEWGIGARPRFLARAGRAADARMMGAAPRMLESLLACERELDERLRFERMLLRQCEQRAADPPRGVLADEQRFIRDMWEWAALTRSRIKSLRDARRKVREAISCARPTLAQARGWYWPDYGDESCTDPGTAEEAA